MRLLFALLYPGAILNCVALGAYIAGHDTTATTLALCAFGFVIAGAIVLASMIVWDLVHGG